MTNRVRGLNMSSVAHNDLLVTLNRDGFVGDSPTFPSRFTLCPQ